MGSRAERRRHKERMTERVKRMLWWPDSGICARAYADNRTPCSCWMCGNQRKYARGRLRLTIQEKRAQIAARDYGL